MGFSTLDAKLYKGTKVSTDLHLTWKKKMYTYTLVQKILYAKLTYFDHLDKNIEHPDLRITKIWV